MSEPAWGDWSFPTRVRFGAGRLQELDAACREAGVHRPLLVTDPGLAALPVVGEARERLERAGLGAEIFAEARGNPTGATLRSAVAAYRAGAHDGVVAVGGGSALDCGKAAALMAGQSRSPWEFRWGAPTPAGAAPAAPVVAVPTTAGTGSELSASAVVVDESAGRKRSLCHATMLPRQVLLDPALTLTLPAELTAWTGLDALSHSLEAYLAPGYHPMADGIAVAALARIRDALPRVVEAPEHLTARGEMLVASAMGAAAFDKGLGGVHALSHAVSARTDSHHGLTNAVLLPFVLAYNRPAAEDRLVKLAAALDLPGSGVDAVLSWIEGLLRNFRIPATLAALGVRTVDVADLARAAVEDPNAAGNPRPLTVEAAAAIYHAALAASSAADWRVNPQ